MKIIPIDDKKNRFVFEVEGVGHTFINILKDELWNDSHVKISTYSVRHPIISKPKVIVETDGSESPKAALSSAISRLKKTSEKFKKEIASGVR
ncbi:MAG TPA: DNA-directed RNA polymerase subunit L [Candidatus Woesearchaeota archaeon]|jgi:DNA-directed RNA polymerase subunit L|nr:DNA-directed RNA polymerase subunit L [Candidatus Woesearchaeota archaeon]HJN56528.1 DNA-directed RNA polymerase subunit L [Candidatus Woesearchaeota archaeon]|tara:strand:- start:18072 stop:18350 length:279 start_codon:yes stop_codon:yes gene_type:complete